MSFKAAILLTGGIGISKDTMAHRNQHPIAAHPAQAHTLMDRSHGRRWRPRLSALTAGLLLAGAAWAQTAAQGVEKPIDIPAQALDKALSALARQTGMRIVFSTDLTEGKQAVALKGTLAPQQALERLLAGSGLVLKALPDGGFTVAPQPQAAEKETTLPVVRVKAAAERETATGPVVGYVAKRSATGTKTDTPILETPQAITVVGAEEIRDRNAVILEEVMRYTPGVATDQGSVDNGRVDYILLRGFDASRRNLLLDGLKYKDNTNDAQLEPFGVERIEILRGPASVLYGQMEPGGVINAVSKRPQFEPFREIGVEVGSWGRRQVAADLTGPVNDDGTLTYRVTALGRKAETTLNRSFDDRFYIAPAFTWKPNASTSLTFLSSHSRAKHNYSWPLNQLQNPGPEGQLSEHLNVSGDGSYFSRQQTTLGYVFEHLFTNDTRIRQIARHSHARNDRREVWAMGLLSDGVSLRRAGIYDRQDSKILSLDTSLETRFRTPGIEHVLLTGLDAQTSRYHWREDDPGEVTALNIYSPDYSAASVVGPDGYFGTNCCTYDETTKGRRLGVYAQSQMKFARWAVTLGGRFDRASSNYSYVDIDPTYNERREKTDRKGTGRAGLVYLFDSGWAPYVSYATSFYPEDGRDADGKLLKPTAGQQVEAGVRYQSKGSSLYFAATVFDLRKQNVVTPISPGSNIKRQIGEIGSKGLELEVRGEPVRSWSVVANLTYLDNEITKSNAGDQGWRQVNVPRHTASVWNALKFAGDLQGGFAAVGIRYVGRSRSGWDSNNSHFNPAATMMDGSLGFDDGIWRYALNVNNLADKRYQIDCDGTWCSKSIGREVRASVAYRF